MGDVLFTFDVEAGPDAVRRALTTTEGITSFWTDKAEVPAEVGGTMTVGFPDAPALFDLVVDQSDQDTVAWRTASFPPQWVGTNIRFELKQEDDFTIVLFRHEGWREPAEFMYHCSTKWAIFLMSLKSLLETGTGQPDPDDVKTDNWN